jgi:hypothetical protein
MMVSFDVGVFGILMKTKFNTRLRTRFKINNLLQVFRSFDLRHSLHFRTNYTALHVIPPPFVNLRRFQ